ncbi:MULTISPECIES: alpha/beta fold hydrolase [unclassified Synechocystis]|uniref:alpha/beta fold hydrolase n=1 Tax=unclassified Synechocystis TaxID=2640012 RepID=UPI000424B574|nr:MULTISPECIES: alpha/beta fold hydrolase [unclassified Synechocystis]AIE74807.1 putative alpha/beta hydrolase superfamily [Synechocystis sp. PCC 6714]MCT0253463.1 alpha/beta fold hydrolase [Synechocystis sp. CS-94]
MVSLESSPSALSPHTPPLFWQWRNQAIAYQKRGDRGPAVLLIHGFGASWGHWRKNIPVLGEYCRCYAIDLLGFGASAKPLPSEALGYTFTTWGDLVADFCREIIGEPTVLIGNSIGCVVAMQTATEYPELVTGLIALNCSLRLLHDRKRSALPWYRQVGASILQTLLGYPQIGKLFFRQIARPNTVRQALCQAYVNNDAVTEDLVTMLLRPAQDPGAAEVFLAFTGYSQGPLPEDLLPRINRPTVLIWGEGDPWEPIALGRELANYDCVEEFISLPGLGHCPQDEAPEVVNPILQQWIEQWT